MRLSISLASGLVLLASAGVFSADFNLNSSSSNSVLIDAINTGSTNKTHLNIASSAPGGKGIGIVLGDGTAYAEGVSVSLYAQNGFGLNSYINTGDYSYAYGTTSDASAGQGAVAYGVNASATATYQGLAYGVYGNAYNYGGGGFEAAGYFNGDAWAYAFPNISDRKFKQNIQDVTGGLDKIMALKPRTYTFKTEEFKGKMNFDERSHIGFIAQEIEQVLPELVLDGVNAAPQTEEERKQGIQSEPIKFKGVDYTGVIPVLVKAVQEQQALIESMRAEIASLKAAK